MKHVKPIQEFNQPPVEEKVKVFLNNIVNKMVSGGFGPSSDHRMRAELADKIKQAVEEVLLKYDYVVESEEPCKCGGNCQCNK